MNRKIIIFIFMPLCFSLVSCGSSKSAAAYGKDSGEYFSSRWLEDHNAGEWPSTDSIANYCTDVAIDMQKEFDWTFQQGSDFSDACAEAVVKGLK